MDMYIVLLKKMFWGKWTRKEERTKWQPQKLQ